MEVALGDTCSLMHNCLYFTANGLARAITRMAEDCFMATGLSPSHAFLVMAVVERDGIRQKELGEVLQLAPSTITRFVDSLVHKGLVTRHVKGKSVQVFGTNKAMDMMPVLQAAWKNLRDSYSEKLGRKEADAMAHRMDDVVQKLEKQPEQNRG